MYKLDTRTWHKTSQLIAKMFRAMTMAIALLMLVSLGAIRSLPLAAQGNDDASLSNSDGSSGSQIGNTLKQGSSSSVIDLLQFCTSIFHAKH